MIKALRSLGFGLALVLAAPMAHAVSTITKPLAQAGCPVEFKPMANTKSPWKPFKGKFKKGTSATGLLLKNGLFQFKVAKPKNFFFRGSAKCLLGKAAPAQKPSEQPTQTTPEAKPPVETPAVEKLPDDEKVVEPKEESAPVEPQQQSAAESKEEVAATPTEAATPPSTSSQDSRSYLLLHAMTWQESLSLEGTGITAEPLSGTQYGLGVGYGFEKPTDTIGWGIDGQIIGAISKASNSAAAPVVTFSGTGIEAGLMLRPFVFYKLGAGFDAGLSLPLFVRYALFSSVLEGSVASPFKFIPMAGSSIRYHMGNAAVGLNFNLVNFSKIFLGLQVEF